MLFWILLTFFTQNTLAQSSCDPNNTVGTTLIYTNGVGNNKDEAKDTSGKINQMLTSDDRKKIDPKGVIVKFSYNSSFTETQGKILGTTFDILEVYFQKTQEAGISPRDAWLNFTYYKSKYFTPMLFLTNGTVFDGLVQLMIAYNYESIQNSRTDTIDKIAAAWSDEISPLNNRRVFAVSHSQGGLFINEVYKKLKAEKTASDMNKIKLFAIADPAGTVEGAKAVNDSYLTYKYDLFIRPLVGSLPGNNTKFTLLDTALRDFLSKIPSGSSWPAYLYLIPSSISPSRLFDTAGFHAIDNFYLSKDYKDLREEVRTKMINAGAVATCGDFTIAQEPFTLDPNLIRFTALNSAPAPAGCDPKDPKCVSTCDPKSQNCLTYTWSIVTKNSQGQITSNRILGSSGKPFIWYRANGEETNILRVVASDGSTNQFSEIEYSVGNSSICGGEPGWYYNFDKFSDFSPASTQSGGFISNSSSATGAVFISADSWLCQGSSVQSASINGSKLYASSVSGVMMSRSTLYYSHVSSSMVDLAVLTNVNATYCSIIGTHSNDNCSYDVWSSSSMTSSPGF